MIQEAIKKTINREDLLPYEATMVMNEIADGKVTEAQIGCLLTALKMKGVSVTEICAFAEVLRSRVIPVQVSSDTPLVDTCGTGGDGAGTFNISTAAAIVAAAAGLPVVKHGNRGVSSRCGSADLLEALGVKIDLTPEDAATSVSDNNIAFLFAPKFHPAMSKVAVARKETGFFSVFNILGPLLNPAGAQARVIGVGEENLIGTVVESLRRLEIARAIVVHGDGIDEITTTGVTKVAELSNGTIRRYTLTPEEFGLTRVSKKDIAGGYPVENAKIIKAILSGKKGPHREIVVLNAAAALYIGEKASCIREGIKMADLAIENGSADMLLSRLKIGVGE